MSADDFAALEHATPIVQVADGVATTTSMRIANGTQVQHKNLRELIEDNLSDFEEFGRVRFETGINFIRKRLGLLSIDPLPVGGA